MTVHTTAYDNARRVIDRFAAATRDIGGEDHVRFTIVTTTTRIADGMWAVPATDTVTGFDASHAHRHVWTRAEAANANGESIRFEITPVFPAFDVDFAGISVEVTA